MPIPIDYRVSRFKQIDFLPILDRMPIAFAPNAYCIYAKCLLHSHRMTVAFEPNAAASKFIAQSARSACRHRSVKAAMFLWE